ncbi:hypothetical protein KW783_01145 [Candidatus Parcubacteria bacterium]|nr:hypothetical protein [Candidatus Parcubacteria bacterium]
MLSEQDINKLTRAIEIRLNLDQRFDEIKSDISGLKESVESLVNSIDGLAKVIDDLRLEYAAIKTQLDKHERWIKEIASKAGVKLKE